MNLPSYRRYATQLGGRELVIETGKYAKQVSGSVTVRYGDTLVLVTAHMNDSGSPLPFLPLTVEYEERHYAIGKIPGSFLRREGRPGQQATLNARITDRQIRPLFPKQLRNEVQVIMHGAVGRPADRARPAGRHRRLGRALDQRRALERARRRAAWSATRTASTSSTPRCRSCRTAARSSSSPSPPARTR